jgi:hypothetical protein
MLVKLGADNTDFAAVAAATEQRANEMAAHLQELESNAGFQAARAAAEREAQIAASAKRSMAQIEAAFGKSGVGVSSVGATKEMGAWSAMQAEAAGHVGEHSLAIGRLEMSLARFSEHATGVNSTLGLLLTSMAKFGIGTIETAGILAGLAAVVAIWEHMTSAARAATEAQDKAIESFEKMQKEKALGPEGTVLAALNAQILAKQAQIDAPQRIAVSDELGHAGSGATGTQSERAAQQARMSQLQADLEAVTKLRDDAMRKQSESDEHNHASQLASLIHFNEQDKAVRAQGLADMKIYQKQLADLPSWASLQQRASITGDISTLKNALFPKSEAHQGEKDTAAQIAGLISAMEQLQAHGQSYASVLAHVLDIHSSIADVTRRTGETLEQWNTRLHEAASIVTGIHAMMATLDKIGDIVKIKPQRDAEEDPFVKAERERRASESQPSNQLTGQLQMQLLQLDGIRARIAISNAQRGTTEQIDPSKSQAVITIQRQMATEAEQLREKLSASGLPAELLASLFQEIDGYLKKGGVALSDWDRQMLALSEHAQQMADAIGGMSAIASALGDKGAAKIFGDLSSAAGSVGAAAAQGFTNPGSDLQAVASIVSVIKDAFDDPLHREQVALMRENNLRLAEVALGLQGFQSSGAGNRTAAGQAAAAALSYKGSGKPGDFSNAAILGAMETGSMGGLQGQIDLLTPYLKAVGLTWLQFAQIAKDSGFQIFDSMGRIAAGPLAQFAAGMADAVKALFTFSSSFSDTLSLITIQDKLAGKTQATDQFAAQLAALQKTAPNLLPGSFNTGTMEGQNSLRDALKALVAALQAGTINPADFGGFTNLQDLLAAINPLIDSLNAMNAATISTTSSLVNVPPTFKYALAAFDATQGDPLAQPAALLPGGGPRLNDTAASGRPTGSGTTINITVANIGITADPTAAPLDEQVDDFLYILRGRALAMFGDANRWSEVQPL